MHARAWDTPPLPALLACALSSSKRLAVVSSGRPSTKWLPPTLHLQGSPDAPRCGFSRKVVEAIQQCGAQFGSFDILSDDGVRQGLKVRRGGWVGGCVCGGGGGRRDCEET